MFKVTIQQSEFLNTIRNWFGTLTSTSPLGESSYKDYMHLHRFIKGKNEEYDDEDKIVFNRLRETYIQNNEHSKKS
jgi:hypothetical protein